jgi:hypothetical protein
LYLLKSLKICFLWTQWLLCRLALPPSFDTALFPAVYSDTKGTPAPRNLFSQWFLEFQHLFWGRHSESYQRPQGKIWD